MCKVRDDMEISDVIIVGGGLFGSANAYGLCKHGLDTAFLDDEDDKLRAARGNFSLVWIQSKGLDMRKFYDWSRKTAHHCHDFTAELKECNGTHIAHCNDDGMHLLLGERPPEFEKFSAKQLNAEGGHVSTHY
jgi:hydrogen cyanide synthase HcnC